MDGDQASQLLEFSTDTKEANELVIRTRLLLLLLLVVVVVVVVCKGCCGERCAGERASEP